jgi:flavodoxin
MFLCNVSALAKAICLFMCVSLISIPTGYTGESQTDKTLIIYYSLSGNTKAGCLAIQKELNADILEIMDLTNRSGRWGFFRSAFGSLLGFHTKIEPEHPDLAPYGNIIIGSPIWTGKLSIPIRTLIDRNRFDGKKVALYTTSNAAEEEKYKEKSRALVKEAGGNVVGYYQVLAHEGKNEEKVPRPLEEMLADTLKLVPEINKGFSAAK